MKLSHARFVTICSAASIFLCSAAGALTIQLASDGADVIAPGDAWQFLRGRAPASDPADAWKQVEFDDSHWETGASGFGMGDGDDATVLTDMQGGYLTVYIRKAFAVPSAPGEGMVQLVIDYDDGFIAYLNGKEVARRSMPAGAVTHATAASSHEAGTPETIVLGPASELLREGTNVLAIEGHNVSLSSTDFSLAPVLHVLPAAPKPATRLTGEMTKDTTLSGICEVVGVVTVPAGRVLTIMPGTTLQMKSGASIVVEGGLAAEGTELSPILFTRDAEGVTWKQIKFVEAADSNLAWCTFEYADSEGAHQDYYGTGSRQYHEAIVVLACHLNLRNCTFQKLPDDKARAEGDAIAVISDDPEHPGPASAHVAGCRFLKIGQGVHTRFSYVLVEDCYFTGKRGDNDDVDLWGESTPPPMVRNNTFLYPEHDDTINPTRCSARIIGNLIVGTDDHGIVLRDKGFPVVMNNVIIDCANGGIAIENSCNATLINNTIVDCGRGLRLFDLGRWDAPYYLNPGGGTATVINCIIWDCATPISLTDSSSTKIADRGSHVTVLYSDIEDGRSGVSVSGQHSTVTWGPGNFDADPLFADLKKLDAHLRSEFGRWDPNAGMWVNDTVTSPCIDGGDPNTAVVFEPFPNGGRANLGAFGNTPQASKSQSGPASGTTLYAFLPDLSTVLQTGGFAGVHWTYRLEGQFDLVIDFEAGTASFSHVDATATYDGPFPRTLDLNEVFNMSGLTGVVGEDRSIRFTGQAHDGSDIVLTMTFQGDLVHLAGETIPPPDSADFFLFTLDALAQRE